MPGTSKSLPNKISKHKPVIAVLSLLTVVGGAATHGFFAGWTHGLGERWFFHSPESHSTDHDAPKNTQAITNKGL